MKLLKHIATASWKLHTFTLATNAFGWWMTTINTTTLLGAELTPFATGDVVFWSVLTGLASLTFIVYDTIKFKKNERTR